MILLPDEHIAEVYKKQIEPNLKEGAAFGLRSRLLTFTMAKLNRVLIWMFGW